MSKQPPPAPTASAVGPCPTVIQIVGRPGTGSLPSTFAPPDHPQTRIRCSIWIHSVFSNISAQYLGSNHHRIFFRVCLKWLNSYRADPDDDEFKFNDASTQWVICV